MKEMSKFQLILTGLFGAFIFIGVLIFALGRFGSSEGVANITVWGWMNHSDFSKVIAKAGLSESETIKIEYVQKNQASFDQEFVEALASGRGPDIVFLSSDAILKHKNKLFPIPFKSLPERDFRDTFVEAGEVYVSSEGILGIPFMIDPLIMYWNRTLFSNASIPLPPKYWSEFYDLTPKLTVKDGSLNITQSMVALGEYSNISHAIDILVTLIMQAGGSPTIRERDTVVSTVNRRFDQPVAPANAALSFYTEFTNPLKPFYSWNRSLPSSKNYFISGDLATYFGYASELAEIRNKNPNLNFDVAKLPQSLGSNNVATFGRMTALAITNASRNKGPAIEAARLLVSRPALTELNSFTFLPPVRRDMLTAQPTDTFMSIFYESAIQARAWLQPDKAETNAVFKEMIESVTGGRRTVSESVQRVDSEIGLLLQKLK